MTGREYTAEFWQEVRDGECYKFYRDELHKLWENDCTKPIEALRYSDFRMFKYTGDRTVYQAQYFVRRRGLNTSALLALIYPEEEKYIIRLMDTIYAICDEYTWCLPAHQTALEKNNNSHLDLFACESAFALAEIDALLGDRLEPLIRDRIRVELERRVISSFESQKFGWERSAANWNAVCSGSLGCALMLLRPELFEKYRERLEANFECYLSGFENDGICKEGVGYWHYGFGFFTVYADMLRRFTGGEVDYFARPKVRTIATFMQKMYLSEGCSVSFSDGGRTALYHLGLLHYLKNEYPDDISLPDPKFSYTNDSCGRWCLHMRAALWLKEEYLTPCVEKKSFSYFAEDSEWLVHKTEKFGFAAKAGNNNEPHNQNDVGSFIVARDGRQIFTDMGSGVYTRQYFDAATRYSILQCSSRGHSLPIIGGVYQHEGGEFAARDVKFDGGVFSADIAAAYPIAELRSLYRSFELCEWGVTLTDRYEYCGDGEIIERFVSLTPPTQISDGEIEVDGARLSYDSAVATPTFDSEQIRDGHTAYFTDLHLKDGVREFCARIKV